MDRLAEARKLLAKPLASIGVRAWIVGGAVRDALLGRPLLDIDIACAGDGETVAAAVAKHLRAGAFPLSERFGGWRVHGKRLGVTIDVIPLAASLADDLARRDFTVNALAVSLDGGDVVDPHGGCADLEARTLRLVSASVFRDDPVRLMRLPRLACELGFDVEQATAAQCRRDAALVVNPAQERIFDELARMLCIDRADEGVAMLAELGLLAEVAPITSPTRSVAAARAAASLLRRDANRAWAAEAFADGLTNGALVVWGATLAADGTLDSTAGRGWAERMRTSTRLRDALERILAPGIDLGRDLRLDEQYERMLATGPVTAACILVAQSCADSAASDARADALRAAFSTFAARLAPGPYLDGNTLVSALGQPPGPWLGRLMRELARQQALGHVTDGEQANLFAKTWEKT